MDEINWRGSTTEHEEDQSTMETSRESREPHGAGYGKDIEGIGESMGDIGKTPQVDNRDRNGGNA